MAFRRFRNLCLLRILLLAATIFLLLYLVIVRGMYATIVITGAAAAAQIYSLLRFVEKTNRDLASFLMSIKYSDFSRNFTGGMAGPSFDELSESFESVMKRFREISIEKEESRRYLQTVVQHVGVGIIAFRDDGEVDLINNAAKRLLGVSHLKNIAALDSISPALLDSVRSVRPGERVLVSAVIAEEKMQISLFSTELRQQSGSLTLLSLHNISMELNEKEMDAWQNLIRVLTHEIKNSLAPIGSLASSVEGLLLPPGRPPGLTAQCGEGDIRDALQTIQKRSRGLLQFVDTYRDLTHIPKPQYTVFRVSDMMGSLERLVHTQAGGERISYSVEIEPGNLELTADRQLIEQVMINLLLNAVQALAGTENPSISVSAGIDEKSRAVIKVADNGPGIVGDALEKVFIPFYSTKKDGSGVGLSLSRQIMRLHRGDLTVTSSPGVETVFRMRF